MQRATPLNNKYVKTNRIMTTVNKVKIYILHYVCDNDGSRVSCHGKMCDLCELHTPLYYEEREVTKDELYELINDSIGNYIRISTVIPEGWMNVAEYIGLETKPCYIHKT